MTALNLVLDEQWGRLWAPSSASQSSPEPAAGFLGCCVGVPNPMGEDHVSIGPCVIEYYGLGRQSIKGRSRHPMI